MQKLDTDYIKSLPVFFILGKGRSGTTLLQTLLDANPHVLIPLESRIIIHLYSQYGKEKNWDKKKILSFYNDLFSDLKFNLLWPVDKEKLKQELLSVKSEASFQLLCKIVYLNYQSVFNKGNIRLLGDKNPIYSVFVPELMQIFPGARFIHLVRDYRANILSHVKVLAYKNVSYLSSKWVYYNDFIENIKSQKPDIFYTLRYEDLINNPEFYLKEVCSFLSITYQASMLDYHKQIKENYQNNKAFIDKYHRNLLNPVNTTKVDTWKTEMKKEDIELMESIAGDYALKKYNYPKSLENHKSFSFASFMNDLQLKFWHFRMRSYYSMHASLRNKVTLMLKSFLGKKYQNKPF